MSKSYQIIKKVFLGSFLVLSGCSTLNKSVLLGAGSGAAIGSIGVSFHPYVGKKGMLYGGLTVGTIGAIIGYFSHKALEKRDAGVRRKTLLNHVPHQTSKKKVYYDLGREKEIFIITDDPKLLRKLK